MFVLNIFVVVKLRKWFIVIEYKFGQLRKNGKSRISWSNFCLRVVRERFLRVRVCVCVYVCDGVCVCLRVRVCVCFIVILTQALIHGEQVVTLLTFLPFLLGLADNLYIIILSQRKRQKYFPKMQLKLDKKKKVQNK